MRSFANYRWVLAMVAIAAVVAALLADHAAQAQGGQGAGAGNGIPQGATNTSCSIGEGVGAPVHPGPTCAACATPPPTSGGSDPPAPPPPSDPGGPTTKSDDDGWTLRDPPKAADGTDDSPAGSTAQPGNGGALDPDSGCITFSLPIGIRGFFCGTPFLNPNGANVVAVNQQDNPGLWTTPTSEEIPPT